MSIPADTQVKLLLHQKADVNARSCSGATALHRSLYSQHLPVTAVLLGSGADPTIVQNSGEDGMSPICQLAERVDKKCHGSPDV